MNNRSKMVKILLGVTALWLPIPILVGAEDAAAISRGREVLLNRGLHSRRGCSPRMWGDRIPARAPSPMLFTQEV